MGQISVEITRLPGSLVSGNQQMERQRQTKTRSFFGQRNLYRGTVMRQRTAPIMPPI